MSAPLVTIDQALADPKLLGAGLGPLESWAGWRAILRAIFGLGLDVGQLEFFRRVAGDRQPPSKPVAECWIVAGRRSGKSRMSAALAVYLATLRRHKLSPGETGYILVLAASKQQAQAVFSYCKGFLEASPILRQQVLDMTSDEIRLKGGVRIAVHSSNYRTIRGRTLLGAIFDELAYWPTGEDAASSDQEVWRAVLPSLSASGGPLICISSPYAMRGLLYERHTEYFGKSADDVLAIRAESRLLNETLDKAMIARAIAQDREAGLSEWEALWRADLALFIDRESIERCIAVGVRDRPPEERFKYHGFVDPSGGASDSMTMAIAHKDGDRTILDATMEVRPPFEPAAVVSSFSELLRRYNIRSIKGDRYAGAWVSSAFSAQGISYVPSILSKSEIYVSCLPALMNAEASLLDDPRLINQLANLERRTSRSGDIVDHPKNGRDDLINSACGAILSAGAADWSRPRIDDLPKVANLSARRPPGRPLDKPRRPDRPGRSLY